MKVSDIIYIMKIMWRDLKKFVHVISEIYKNWLVDFPQIEAIFSKTNYTTFSHLLIPYNGQDTSFYRHLVLITLQQTMPQRE